MRRFLITILIVLFMGGLFLGCEHAREWSLELAQEDFKNAQTAREVSEELIKGWPVWSGTLKGGLGERIDELPLRAIKAWQELDAICFCYDNAKWPPSMFPSVECSNGLTDYEYGYYLGTRARMLYEIVIEAINMIAPDLLKSIPLLL